MPGKEARLRPATKYAHKKTAKPNPKSEIQNNLKIPSQEMTQTKKYSLSYLILNLKHWDLFRISELGFSRLLIRALYVSIFQSGIAIEILRSIAIAIPIAIPTISAITAS
jgi:hypothetical protein